MKNIVKTLYGGLICLILFHSCDCPDDVHYHIPPEAVKYYDDHDTIRYYCEETQTFETYIVCNRTELHEYETTPDRCEQEFHYYSKSYICYKDSCNSQDNFRLNIETRGYSDFDYFGNYRNQNDCDALWANYDESSKLTLSILGHTYENTIYIKSLLDDSLVGIRVSYEYGVIQRQFEHLTFSLVNDEDQ